MLWLWCRLAAVAPVRPLAWEPPYAKGTVLKRKKREREKEREREEGRKEGKRKEERERKQESKKEKNIFFIKYKFS